MILSRFLVPLFRTLAPVTVTATPNLLPLKAYTGFASRRFFTTEGMKAPKGETGEKREEEKQAKEQEEKKEAKQEERPEEKDPKDTEIKVRTSVKCK